jgi:hypothetical protein
MEGPAYRTLAQWRETCAELDVATIEEQYAPVFLVCKAGSALQVPEGPQATMRVNLKLIEAAKRGDKFHLECPVWPLRRREESVYSFISVGRTSNCDVQIPDESISKLHTILRIDDQGLAVQDAGSRNKTYVDGAEAPKRGAGTPLHAGSGATVQFGGIETVVVTAVELCAIVSSLAPE